MNIQDLFFLVGGNVWLYGGAFILVLSILVFVHEWGHYIVARWCGVKVESFSVGFGKEIFGIEDKNGTRWKISLIPLGGYVKLFGDVDPASYKHDDNVDGKDGKKRKMTKKEKEVAFFNKPVWQRALVVAAGPGINYLFAIILLSGLYMFNGQPITQPQAAAVIGGSAAAESGFQPHDMIISIDGKNIESFEDIRREMMIALDGKKHFVIERDGQLVDIYAAPKKIEMEDRFGFQHSRGLLGLISPRHVLSLDNIETVNGRSYDEVEALRNVILGSFGETLEIEIKRSEDVNDVLMVKPLADMNAALSDPEDPNHNLLFLSAGEGATFHKLGPLRSMGEAVEESVNITLGTLEALGQMIMGERSAKELGGIIRIGALAGDMAQQGFIALLLFTALLSINLGLINLFPIPLLDGGHLVFYAFEAVLGKPIPDHIQEYAFRFGLAFLVCVMVFANLNDIMQLIL